MPTLQPLFNEAATDAEIQWLSAKQQAPLPALLTAFVAAPRFVKRRNVPGKPDWTMDQLARMLLLQTLCDTYPTEAIQAIETLFDTAEMQELAALYSALPLLPQPGHWLLRATDAVRSNMGPVFDAIAFGNTYPAAHFSEAAWNQLVLKCIFNDKPLGGIVGLHERANAALAQHLSDLAHERWAAGRHVPAEAWLLVRNFITETIRQDLLHLAQSDRAEDKEIAEKLMKNVE
jgi:hypothetical protein